MVVPAAVGSTNPVSFEGCLAIKHSFHAVVDAIAHIHIKLPRLTKERLVTGCAAAIAVASGFVLGIRLGFHNHAPQQAAVLLAFHQQATNQVGGDQLGRAGEEGLGESWEELGGRGGYGSGSLVEITPTC
jgi:hypothetical protein